MSSPSLRGLMLKFKQATPATVNPLEAPTGAACDITTCQQPATGTEPTQMQESSAALREVRRAAFDRHPTSSLSL
jgi:hypothetical protein